MKLYKRLKGVFRPGPKCGPYGERVNIIPREPPRRETRQDKIYYSLCDIERENPDLLVDLYNKYAEEIGDRSAHIYRMSEFDAVFQNKTPLEIARIIPQGDFEPYFSADDGYFRILYDADGAVEFVESFQDVDDFVDNGTLAEYIDKKGIGTITEGAITDEN